MNKRSQENFAKDVGDFEFESDPNYGKYDDFYENLAFHYDDSILDKIGRDIKEMVDKDEQDREGWLSIQKQGIQHMGLGNARSQLDDQSDTTNIYAPSLTTSSVQVANSLYSKFFPPNGFCQTTILGSTDEELEDMADRIKDGMTELVDNIMPEYKPDRKQGFLWMVSCGSIFVKPYIDKLRNKPAAPFIRPEDIIVNSTATCLEDAERITHRFQLSKRIVDQYFSAGLWKERTLEVSEVQTNMPSYQANADTGVRDSDDDEDKRYSFDETLWYMNMDDYDRTLHVDRTEQHPYIVVRDRMSDRVVAIYRHWDPEDKLFKAKQHIIQHRFMPGFNIYGLGIFQLCLGLARAETDLFQQLIKALRLSNNPALLMATGLKSERSQYDTTPGGLTMFQTFDKTIGDSLMPAPFKEPSPMYLDLLDRITKTINDRCITNQMRPEDIPTNVSTTTMMGIMSLMQIQESALMNELYDSFKKEFQILFTLFGEWLPDEEYPFLVPGAERKIMKTDFTSNIAIRPTVDPNQASQTFQLVTNEALLQLAQSQPELYNMRFIHKRILTSMNINNIDEIMTPEEQDPLPIDPVSENMHIRMGEPVKAYKIQDHDAHIMVHSDMLMRLKADQENDNSEAIGALESHIREHKNFAYLLEMERASGKEIPENPEELTPTQQNKIAKDVAETLAERQEEFAANNPPPIDPNQVVMEELRVEMEKLNLEKIKAEMKAQEAQAKMNIEMQRMQIDAQVKQAELALGERKEINEEKRIEIELMRIRIEEQKLQLLMREQDVKLQLGIGELEVEDKKRASMMESKAYDATLRYDNQSDKEVEYAKIQADRDKAELDAEVKSYDATLDFNKEEVNPSDVHTQT